MANEGTTTSLNDIIATEVTDNVALDYAHDWSGIARHCLSESIIGRGTSSYRFWRLASQAGTVGDAGSGVATAYDVSEGTDMSNTAISTDSISISTSEYGVQRTITDEAMEDSITGIQFLQMVPMDAARILTLAFEDDLAALLGNFSNTAGSTTVDLTLANLSTCIVGIRNRGVRAPDGLVGWLDEAAAADYENALVSTNAAAAVYSGAADRHQRANSDANNGLTDGAIGDFRGVPLHQTGLTDTANAGADVESAIFVPFTPANRAFCALATVVAREFRVEPQRDASLRATEFNASMRKGGGELNDVCGQTLITDA